MSSKITGNELVELKNAVVKDFSESNWKELGVLTDTIQQIESHPRLLRSLGWGDPDYEGHALQFLREMLGPNDERREVVIPYIHTHCKSIGTSISCAQTTGSKIVFSPSVFKIPDVGIDHNLISVMMPFKPEFAPVFKAICEAANSAGFRCQKADDIWENAVVIQDVFSLIYRSHIVVCDFTGHNPNVFYETGIAHTLGKHVVPITQSSNDLPFDLAHHRIANYAGNVESIEKLRGELIVRFKHLAHNDSPPKLFSA